MTKLAMTDDKSEAEAAHAAVEALAGSISELVDDTAPDLFDGRYALCIALARNIAEEFDSEADIEASAEKASLRVLSMAIAIHDDRIAEAQAEAKTARLQ